MTDSDSDDSDLIKRYNGELRRTLKGGSMLIDPMIYADGVYIEVMEAVANSGTFDEGCERYEDAGVVVVRGRRYQWEIDARDKDRVGRSPDATNPEVTTRVLTVYPLDNDL